MEFHRSFVMTNSACFFVDDLWIAMYLKVCGTEVVSLHDQVKRRGMETIYKLTDNASVLALMELPGKNRRDRVTMLAFSGLLARLERATLQQLTRWGGADAVQRIRQLGDEARNIDKQIALRGWLELAPCTGREPPSRRAPSTKGQFAVVWHVEDHAEGELFLTEHDAGIRFEQLVGGDYAAACFSPQGAELSYYGNDECWIRRQMKAWRKCYAKGQGRRCQVEKMSRQRCRA
eukprot:gnl/TRDRNA2_/TRDRNA2_121121_c0_seq2.p1 gnl/TRDRNA2_/TRDRNA2_121121_c0~~gnl/TRDRNA2_/TRDRNA2_121121_c0_seq2.p1  ORF type:complete len:265 (-),score=40.54 gnl/TRDRNA2_/TRDRNA2_121121_c0_seq2:111-809(-)